MTNQQDEGQFGRDPALAEDPGKLEWWWCVFGELAASVVQAVSATYQLYQRGKFFFVIRKTLAWPIRWFVCCPLCLLVIQPLAAVLLLFYYHAYGNMSTCFEPAQQNFREACFDSWARRKKKNIQEAHRSDFVLAFEYPATAVSQLYAVTSLHPELDPMEYWNPRNLLPGIPIQRKEKYIIGERL